MVSRSPLSPALVKKLIAGALIVATPAVVAFEGMRHTAYYDPVGIPTICAGLTSGVRIGDSMTPQQCDAATQQELGKVMDAVIYSIDPSRIDSLPETRLAAFASFTYNVGVGAFKRSTLLRKFNAGDTVGACNQLLLWTKATYMGVRVTLPGLVKRREAERQLCLEGL